MVKNSFFFSKSMREMRTFLGAALACDLSDPLLRFGISWYVLQQTDSTALFAAVYGLSSLFEALARPILAPIADHFNRIKVFRWCAGFGALAALALLAAIMLLPFSPFLMGGILIVQCLVAALRDPTIMAVFPHLVGPAEMTRAASLRSMFNSLVFTAGPVLAGTVLALTNAETTIAIAAGVEVLGLLLSFLLKPNPALDKISETASRFTFSSVWAFRIREGQRSLWLNRSEWITMVNTALLNGIFVTMLAIVLPVWAVKYLGGSPGLMAQLEVSMGLGILVGSGWALNLCNTALGRARTAQLGPILAGLALLGVALFNHTWLACAALFCFGVGISLYFVNVAAVRSAATPGHFRSRLIGAFGFMVGLGGPLLMQMAGIALEYVPVSYVCLTCAVVAFFAAAIHSLNNDSIQLLRQSDEDIEGAYVKLYPAAFIERDGKLANAQ